MKDHLGGPAPAVGDVLCNGFVCHDSLRSGPVLCVCAPQGRVHRWAAIVQTGDSLHIVTDIDLHVGNWRSADRADEDPCQSDAAQKRQRAAWRAAEKTSAPSSATVAK